MPGVILDNETREFIETTARNAFWDRMSELCWNTYFLAFAAAAILLLLYPFLPAGDSSSVLIGGKLERAWLAMGRQRRQIAQFATVLLLLLCALSQQTVLDERRGFIADQDKRYEAEIRKLSVGKNKDEALRAQYLYMPEGNSLAYISLGNTSIAADYVWLTSAQYVSNTFRRGHKFEMLLRFYMTMLELDPNWIEAQVNAGKVLSALEPDRFQVEKFYEQAVIKNPDSEVLAYEAARLFVVPPMDPNQQQRYSRRAVLWFDEALAKLQKKPPSPERERRKKEIENQVARLSLESGPAYYEVADELLLKQVLDPDNPEAMRSASARGWLSAHSLFVGSKIESAVAAYKEKMGQFPPSLAPVYAAVTELNKFKQDAYGFPFEYDPATGKVSSHGVKARRAIQAASVINSLLANYRADNGGASPKDLRQLQDFIQHLYSKPNDPPSSPITDALGVELNTTVNPLGQPWNYDPKQGRVIPPPESDPATLFQNADRLLKEVMTKGL